jgi:hypothetical protein
VLPVLRVQYIDARLFPQVGSILNQHSDNNNRCFVERMSVFICFCTQKVQCIYVVLVDEAYHKTLSHQDNRAYRPNLEPVMNERM